MRRSFCAAEDKRDAQAVGMMAERYDRADQERMLTLNREMAYHRCSKCGGKVNGDRPSGLCASCRKNPGRSQERALAQRSRRVAHDTERKSASR